MFKKINFVFLLAMLSASIGWTQEKIPVTVAAGQPPRSLPSLAKVNEFFIPEVNKRIKAAGLKYQIDWTEAYAGSLLKPLQMLDGTKDGVTGIGFIPIGFYPDKLPLEQLSFTVPFATTDVLTISRIMNRLHKAFPEFGAQYEKFNQVRLGGSGVDSYELLTTFPVKSIDVLVAWNWGHACSGQYDGVLQLHQKWCVSRFHHHAIDFSWHEVPRSCTFHHARRIWCPVRCCFDH